MPTLAIGGELDGLNRVSRMMEEYYHRIAIAPDRQVAVATFPVIVVKGMNHFEFASGSMPLLVREQDLKAEISFDNAYSTVAMYTPNHPTPACYTRRLCRTTSMKKGTKSTLFSSQILLT